MEYIEEHLTEDIDYREISKMWYACLGVSFQRMFSFYREIGLSEYISPQKINSTALDLKDKSMRIIDAARQIRLSDSAEIRSRVLSFHLVFIPLR